jgi:hypothetical protein
MNQYICRVCKGNECTVLTSQVPPNCGCLHNSDIGALWEQDSSYKSEREKMLKVLREQHDVFQSELDDEENPFPISYRQGKENGLRIAILEVESRQSKDGES